MDKKTVVEKTNTLEALKNQMIENAKAKGINLQIFQFIDENHQYSLWYGGTIAIASKGHLRCEIYAAGNVCTLLKKGKKELSFVNDKSNDGKFYEEMRGLIPDDKALSLLERGESYNGMYLILQNSNWFEWNMFDEEKQKWIGSDFLDNVMEEDRLSDCLNANILEDIFAFVKEYEAE